MYLLSTVDSVTSITAPLGNDKVILILLYLILTDLIKVVVKLLVLTKVKVTNYILVTIVIIPPGTCSDVVVYSPSPAELLSATIIAYVPS